MIIDIFLLLIGIGAASALYSGERFSKFLSLLLAFVVAGICLKLYQNWQLGYTDNFTYDWVKSRYYPVKINMFSNAVHYMLMLPFFVVAAVILLFNTFLPAEEKRLRLSGLVCFNLSALTLLICSENAIQLLVSACIIDIFGFYAINDSRVRRKYIFYNLLANMGLFMLFALLWGYIHTIRLERFSLYAARGEHKDLVCILLLLCLFVKSGLFGFHTTQQEWRMLGMNRIMLLSYLSTPIAGIIILSKTAMLLPLSGYSLPLLHIFGIASMGWGLFGALFIDELRRKAIYFNMILYGLIYYLLSQGFSLQEPAFAWLIVSGFLLNGCWLLVFIGASNENNVSAMGGFISGLKLTLGVTLIVTAAYMQALLHLYPAYPVAALGGGIALLIGVTSLLYQIYLGKSHADERVQALLHNPGIVFGGTIAALAAAIIWQNGALSPYLLWTYGLFVILFVTGISRFANKAYRYKFIQKTDLFSTAYHLFIVGPIKVLGRVLWLTVDFLIIERTVINSLHKMLMILINIFQRLHTDSRWAYVFFFLAGGVLAGICWKWGGK